VNEDEPVSVAAAAGLNARPVRRLLGFLNKLALLICINERDGAVFCAKVKRLADEIRVEDSKGVGYQRIKLVTCDDFVYVLPLNFVKFEY
jgi:hypothetical protein